MVGFGVYLCLGFLFRVGWLGFFPSILEGRNKCGSKRKYSGVCSGFCHEAGLDAVYLQGCLSWIQGMLCSVLVLLTHLYLWHRSRKKGEKWHPIKEGSSKLFPSSEINLPCCFTEEYQNIKRSAGGSSEISTFYSVTFTEGKILHPAFGTMENWIMHEKIL